MDDALRYPLRGEHAEKALLAAWICVFVHAIVLPFVALVPLAGYAASVLATAPQSDPPPFLDRRVLSRSVGAIGLGVGYLAVPLATALVTVRLLLGTGRAPTGGDAIVVLVGSTAVLFVLAVAVYLLPIALANYARSGSIRAGFSGLGTVAGHTAYFVGWCSGIVLLLLGVAVSSALVDLGGFALVAGSFVGAYATVAAARRIGRGYAAATR
ncbi:DUF4013 domain-containing protein [Natronococcus pandeyae]|nr:DUF4013 domain-containing protein [Natronococcus pandeyae]